jgi:hypothetical protein
MAIISSPKKPNCTKGVKMNTSKTGPKTKASQGLQKHKRLNVTLPPELWAKIETIRLGNEKTSHLIARLLEAAVSEDYVMILRKKGEIKNEC